MIRSAETIRVLSVVDEYPPSICGIGDYSAALARALVDKGVEVEILTKAVSGLPSRETVDGVAIQRSANGWRWADLRPILRTADELASGFGLTPSVAVGGPGNNEYFSGPRLQAEYKFYGSA